MRSTLRWMLFGAAACGLLAPTASACPACGIGDGLSVAALVTYGIFMATPFALAYGVYRYIKAQDRE